MSTLLSRFAQRLRSRLVLRIYGVGLLQFALVAAGIVMLAQLQRRPPQGHADSLRLAGDGIALVADDPARLEAEVERVADTMHWSVNVNDDQGRTLLHRGPSLVEETSRGGGAGLRRRALSGNRTLVLLSPLPPPHGFPFGPVALVLLVVGVASSLTARSFAGPLARLSRAATAFGKGDLAARVGLARSDELGEVARAFDDMADQVVKALRAEKELLANVSHELRTPLQRIRIAMDIAAEGDGDAARDSLAEIHHDVIELERIVDDVLTAARLSLRDPAAVQPVSGPPTRFERIDLNAMLERSVARFRAFRANRPLHVELADDLPPILADGVLLRRAVDNLLDNADKYSEDPHAEVRLAARVTEGRVLVEVRDQGIGIGPADLARVFEPFFRADRSRTRATGGLGLGLVLARRVVEAHGGTLSLSSDLGVGTVASLSLPVSE